MQYGTVHGKPGQVKNRALTSPFLTPGRIHQLLFEPL